MLRPSIDSARPQGKGTVTEVFVSFLKLGLTSFGGPIAHLGYFRTEFVARRRWLSDSDYSDLVALCQFLPGPTSSQVGMAIGLGRAGWLGMFAAWLAFTLPSAIALILFAYGVAQVEGAALSGWIHGLKIVAVAIVAQAVWGMSNTLCPDRPRIALAVSAALITLALPSAFAQVAAIAVAGIIGWLFLPAPGAPADFTSSYPVTRRQAIIAITCFLGLLLGLPLAAELTGNPTLSLVEGVYRAGALVFGGGHVVLPLLQATVVSEGFVSNTDFLAGYGAAQAVPGPLFTFSAYLGSVAQGALSGWLGGLVLLAFVFLPAVLLLVSVLPFWEALRNRPAIQSAMAGINAGVVGILLSALYNPVWTSAIHSRADFGLALTAFALLVLARVPPAPVVVLTAGLAWLMR